MAAGKYNEKLWPILSFTETMVYLKVPSTRYFYVQFIIIIFNNECFSGTFHTWWGMAWTLSLLIQLWKRIRKQALSSIFVLDVCFSVFLFNEKKKEELGLPAYPLSNFFIVNNGISYVHFFSFFLALNLKIYSPGPSCSKAD